MVNGSNGKRADARFRSGQPNVSTGRRTDAGFRICPRPLRVLCLRVWSRLPRRGEHGGPVGRPDPVLRSRMPRPPRTDRPHPRDPAVCQKGSVLATGSCSSSPPVSPELFSCLACFPICFSCSDRKSRTASAVKPRWNTIARGCRKSIKIANRWYKIFLVHLRYVCWFL